MSKHQGATCTCSVDTVEPLNKGHFGSKASVLYTEVVLWWEVRLNLKESKLYLSYSIRK